MKEYTDTQGNYMHIKGDWKFKTQENIEGSKDWVVYIDGARPDLPETHVATMGIQHECDVDSGKLIAAAPDLLAACEAVMTNLWADCRLPIEVRKEFESIYHNMVVAAVRKAKG